MDLSALSDTDLQALKAGDLTKVSDQGLAHLKSQSAPTATAPATAAPPSISQTMVDVAPAMGPYGKLIVGGARGAKDIVDTGAEYLAKGWDKLTSKAPTLSTLVAGPPQGEADRVKAMNAAGEQEWNAAANGDPALKAGRLAGQAAITYPVGGVLGETANLLRAPKTLVNALTTSGFSTGEPVAANALARATNLATRSVGGAITGGVSAGLVDPNAAAPAAVVGALLPPAMRVAGAAGSGLADVAQASANRLMQSALKPTIAQLRSGEAATAVKTLLDYGVNPTEKGVQKLKDLIGGLNDQIAAKVGASDATVSKSNVVNALAGTKQKFGNQVSPTADLNAIGGVESDFLNHPLAPGEAIPVQTAQQMKQGTYKVLAGKYGQLGSAETEAQKSLARGLKDEIATAVPGVGELNAEESRLLSTLSVAERRALMDANKNPGGLALLAHDPWSWAAFMADKSAAFKSLAARAINAAVPATTQLNALAAPAVYRGLPRSSQTAGNR